MTPKEKAKELVESFKPYINNISLINDNIDNDWGLRNAKQCVLITVNELIQETRHKYWYDVKHEIENYDRTRL